MRVSRAKTHGLTVVLKHVEKVDRQTVKISGGELKKVNNFRYLWTLVEENGGIWI